MCKDRLFPKIGYFAKAYGKNEEPRRAYALTFIIAMAMIGIGIVSLALFKTFIPSLASSFAEIVHSFQKIGSIMANSGMMKLYILSIITLD